MFETHLALGEADTIGQMQIRPVLRVTSVFSTFFGITWLRPEAVHVTNEDGNLQIIRVSDSTRRLQVVLTLLLTLTGLLLIKTINRFSLTERTDIW
jgi:hypothetical protein